MATNTEMYSTTGACVPLRACIQIRACIAIRGHVFQYACIPIRIPIRGYLALPRETFARFALWSGSMQKIRAKDWLTYQVDFRADRSGGRGEGGGERKEHTQHVHTQHVLMVTCRVLECSWPVIMSLLVPLFVYMPSHKHDMYDLGLTMKTNSVSRHACAKISLVGCFAGIMWNPLPLPSSNQWVTWYLSDIIFDLWNVTSL